MTCNSPHIAVYANTNKPLAMEVAQKLVAGTVGDYVCQPEILTGKLDADKLKNCSYLMVVGGDGTILSAVRDLAGLEIPIIGVNVGKLGFLARFSIEELISDFKSIAQAGLQAITEHKLLKCDVFRENQILSSSLVVNEIAVVAGLHFRMLDVSIKIGQENITNCLGDGIIVSTPIGSTAYNLSAGGPILGSDLECVAITPLAAHSLNFRPIVVGINKPIIIQCNSNAATALVDGQINMPMILGDSVRITQAKESFRLVQNQKYNQWQVLTQKLHWARQPEYNNNRSQT